MFNELDAAVTRTGAPPSMNDSDWFGENSDRFLRLRHGHDNETDLLLAFHPHDTGPIHILAVPEGKEPKRWLLDNRTSYGDIWLAFPAFEALVGQHLLRAKLVSCLSQGKRLTRDWTAADYRPGEPRQNAEVFAHIWHRSVYGIDDIGLFEVGDGSAGTILFRAVVDAVRRTDEHHKLSADDAENAVAMLYHLTPEMKYG